MIGDPVSPGQDFPHLQNAANEMRSIEGLFAVANRKVIARTEATPGAYEAASPAQFSLVHFVAHSLAEREQPLESALILSPQDNEYRLSARTISSIPLKARLVTLSACKGAGIRTYSGEGSVGLAWAFLHAGAESVVAGLWDVDDTSTAILMADFYARLQRGSSSAEALHQAKLQCLHTKGALRKPYYWGAFQLFSGTTN
jgi:CHAT domain-containing protein